MAESSLHAAIKSWVSQPGDSVETIVDGYIIDLRRGDDLIEIQTRSFSNLRPKLERLLPHYRVHLLHPIPVEKWITRVEDGRVIQRRKSPKHGRSEHMFKELVYIPHLLFHPNFSLQILLTREEEFWMNDGNGSWRRKGWSIADRKLISVEGTRSFNDYYDYLGLLPGSLPIPFTTTDLAGQAKLPINLAQKMTYTLRKSGVLIVDGKHNRSYHYAPNPIAPGF
jgi:hypothetical protein